MGLTRKQVEESDEAVTAQSPGHHVGTEGAPYPPGVVVAGAGAARSSFGGGGSLS